MRLLTGTTGILACLAAMLMPAAAVSASEMIAHRSVYHYVDINRTLSENSD